jgi:putative aminopeptidase FrvX
MKPQELNRQRTQDFRPGESLLPRYRARTMRYHPPTRWIKLAVDLLRLPTSPFHEHNVMLAIWRYARNHGFEVHADAVGNLVVDYVPESGVAADRPRVLFTAHMDHVGFWAVEMIGERKLRAHWMGRFPEELLLGAKVMFWTGGKPLSEIAPELLPDAADEMRIGGRRVGGVVRTICGYNAEGDVAEVEIEIDEPVMPGSVGMWDLPDPDHRDGRLYARGIDDVAGAASLLSLLDDMKRTACTNPVRCLFTRAEEGGFFGSIHYCRESLSRQPGRDIVISVETSKALENAPLGRGPIVRVGDRHSVFEPELIAWSSRCAESIGADDASFSWQRRLMDGGTCESSVFQAWTGRAGALCIALGNYHNFNVEEKRIDLEYIDLSDFGNLVRLMRTMVDRSDDAGDSFARFKHWCQDWERQHAHLYLNPTAVAASSAAATA